MNNKKCKLLIMFIIIVGQICLLGTTISLSKVSETDSTRSLEDGIYIIRSIIDEKYVIDISQASQLNEANVQLFTYDNVDQQRFDVKYIGDGCYTITALHSNKVLDVSGAGKTSGTNVWQYELNNSDAQKWIIKDEGNKTYSIISKCNELYLDVAGGNASNGTNVQVYEGNGTKAQKFKFDQVKKQNNQDNQQNEQTETIEDGTYVIRSTIDEKYVIDISQASQSNEANVQLFTYDNVDQQRFDVKYIGDGCYTITALHSNKVLDVSGAGKTSGTNVWQYELNNSDAQKWIIKDEGNKTYSIISKCNELYLDVAGGNASNGTNVQVYEGNGTKAQKFKFDQVKKQNNQDDQKNEQNEQPDKKVETTVLDGIYSIESAASSNYVLDVQGGSKNNYANVQLYKKQAANREKFKVKSIGDGYYTITAVHSNKVVDVAEAGKTSGTNVWQYEFNNTDAQKWIIKDVGNGYYNIISKLNGLYLDVLGANATNGTNIQVYEGNGTKAQRFKFVEPLNLLDSIDTVRYPGYKEKISNLMDQHPGWNFELLYTGLKFGDVTSGEVRVHSTNLVPKSSSGEFVCSVCGQKEYDSGWYCASEKAVAYYMDPRNFLDEVNVFQFQWLNEYIQGVCSLEGIQNKVNGTFLQNYAVDIDNACRNQNVNSYYIIARVLQEQGKNGTTIGRGMNGGDGKTYYNPFNIGASGNGDANIYANALARAKSEGWDTMQKALEGGITFCKKNWLENYQDTLYQNKFDIDTRNGSELYSHQYMQNLLAAYEEAKTLRSMYVNTNKLESNFTFIIPVYEDMDSTSSQMPSSKSEVSPINVRVTAPSGLWVREGADANSGKIKLLPYGEVILSVKRGINSDWQQVVLTDGRVGYMSGAWLEQVADVTNCRYTARVKTNDGDGCNVRLAPTTEIADKVTALSDGSTVTVINEGTYNGIKGYNWLRVQLSDGRQGFMPSQFLIRQ